DYIHANSTKNGVTTSTKKIDDGQINGFYKWDTKPDRWETQNDIIRGQNSGIIRPEDNNIELYISVFGKEIVQTGVDDYPINSNSLIFPNPSKGFVTLKLNLETSCSPIIRII